MIFNYLELVYQTISLFHLRLYPAVAGYLRLSQLSQAIKGYVCLSMAISDYFPLFPDILGYLFYLWLYWAICSYTLKAFTALLETHQPCQFSSESQSIPFRGIKKFHEIKNSSKGVPYKIDSHSVWGGSQNMTKIM